MGEESGAEVITPKWGIPGTQLLLLLLLVDIPVTTESLLWPDTTLSSLPSEGKERAAPPGSPPDGARASSS